MAAGPAHAATGAAESIDAAALGDAAGEKVAGAGVVRCRRVGRRTKPAAGGAHQAALNGQATASQEAFEGGLTVPTPIRLVVSTAR